MRHLIIYIALFLSAMAPATGGSATAQNTFGQRDSEAAQQPPISWRGTARLTSADEGVITLTATMAPGWHLYGTEMPEGGPRPTAFTYHVTKGWSLKGKTVTDKAAVRKHDPMFDADVQFWEGKVTFTQHFRLNKKEGNAESIRCTVSFMGCNDETCLPPQQKEFTLKILPRK